MIIRNLAVLVLLLNKATQSWVVLPKLGQEPLASGQEVELVYDEVMVVVSVYVPHEATTISSPDSSIVVVTQVVAVVFENVAGVEVVCWVVDVDVTDVTPAATPLTVGITPFGG